MIGYEDDRGLTPLSFLQGRLPNVFFFVIGKNLGLVHLDMRRICKRLVITKSKVKNADHWHRDLLGTCNLKFLVITRTVFFLGGVNFDGYTSTLECL
jgi:hypothetical protein